jgi:hypothetical protein
MQRDALERLSKAELIAFALFGNSGAKPNRTDDKKGPET